MLCMIVRSAVVDAAEFSVVRQLDSTFTRAITMDIFLPNTELDLLGVPTQDQLIPKASSNHKPRILLLYGSTRPRSFGRLLVEEAERLLRHQLRVLGRWMRMFTIPNQSSVPKVFQEFDEENRMKPSSYYDRLVDVTEELAKFTLLLRDRSDYLVDRYSERVESAEAVSRRVNKSSI